MYSDEADFTPPGGVLEWIRSNFLLVSIIAFIVVTCGMCGLMFYAASTGSFTEQLVNGCIADSTDIECESFVEEMQSTYRSLSFLVCSSGICLSAVVVLIMTIWKSYFAR